MENILKKRRSEKKMTLEQVGKLVGVGKSTVRKWENGLIQNMGRDNIVALSKALDLSPLEILGMESNDITTIYNQLNDKRKDKVYTYAENQLNEQERQKRSRDNVIELADAKEKRTLHEVSTPNSKDISVEVDGILTAGCGTENFNKGTSEIAYVSSVPKQYNLAFRVSGDSMYPTFEDGEIVFVIETDHIHNGMMVAVEIDGSAFLKKIYLTEDNIRLVSLNDDVDENGDRLFPDIYANKENEIYIIGKVVN